MKFPLLYIRSKQLRTEINGLGLYTFIFIAFVLGLSFIFYKQFIKGNTAYILGAFAFFCTGIQVYRKDKLFAYKHIANTHIQFFLEYVLLTLPFSVLVLITKNWFYYPALLVILFCITFIKYQPKQKTVFKNISSIISLKYFEWISGFRKNYFLFISLYLVAVVFCWVRIFPLILLWFLTILIMSFHTECESIQILREGNKTPRKYLFDKYKSCTIYIGVFYTPVIIINSIFNIEFLLINLFFLFTQTALLFFTISLKYTTYKPNANLNGNAIPTSIISLCSALPYFFPIPVILSFIYFNKARKNLKQYLND